MKRLLVVPAILTALLGAQAMAADEQPARAPLSLRPGQPPATPSVNYPRTAESSAPGDPAAQLRELRSRIEALDKRVAELEKKNPPAPMPVADRPEPARLRLQPR